MSKADETSELTAEERKKLRWLLDEYGPNWPSRRQAIAGGTAAMLGAGTFAAGRVSADASSSDSDGDVGQSNNRVDVFADGIDANSVSTEDLSNADKYADAFSGTTTGAQIQAALDSITAGAVQAPRGDGHQAGSTISMGPGEFLRGVGTEATLIDLQNGVNADLIQFSNGGSQGIFGGVTDISLNGSKADNTAGSGIHSNGDVIDGFVGRAFVQNFVDHGIYLQDSASRWRVAWCHIEKSDKEGLYVGGGSGLKVVGNHFANVRKAIDHRGSSSVFIGNDVIAQTGDSTTGHAVEFVGATGNQYIGGRINGPGDRAFNISGQDNSFVGVNILSPGTDAVRDGSGANGFYNLIIEEAARRAYLLKGAHATVNGGRVSGWNGSSGGYPAFDIDANNVTVSDVYVAQTPSGFSGTNLAEIAGDDVYFNVYPESGTDVTWSITVESGSADVVIDVPQITRANVTNNGNRTVVNGVGVNAGDPSSTGQWNGNGREGVIVRDTTNANTYLYNNGSWSQIAST